MNSKSIEHTLLKADASREDYLKLIQEAIKYDFYGVCVPPYFVRLANTELEESDIKVITVIGFPFGYNTGNIKVEESKRAIEDGADEIDMVMNLAAFKSKEYSEVVKDIESVATICRLRNKVLKVIIETPLLTETEIVKACEICADSDVEFVKTSTGFNSSEGTRPEDVKIMRDVLPLNIKIKAAGGIRNRTFAKKIIEAGAERIGTSSGVALVK